MPNFEDQQGSLRQAPINEMYPKFQNVMTSFEREIAVIREQNHYLNRQFNENLMDMKEHARQLSSHRSQV